MTNKIYIFQYEAHKFFYGLGKGHQQYIHFILPLEIKVSVRSVESNGLDT